MNLPGRPKGEYGSAPHDGAPRLPAGGPSGEYRGAPHEGTPLLAPGSPNGEYRGAQREGMRTNAARPSLADLIEERRRAERKRPPGRGANRLSNDRFARWHVPEVIEQEPDNWLLTYLDLLTLLLAMLVVMLGISRLDLWRKPGDTQVVVVGSVDRGGLPAYDGAYARLDDLPVIPAAWAQLPDPVQAAPASPQPGAAGPAGPAPAGAQPVEPPPPPPPSAEELGLDDLGDSIQVQINQRSVSFRISNELLFPSGQATLSSSGLGLIKRLSTVVNRSKHPLSVEGHSDNVPIQTRQFPSNWELSTSRATSVLRALVRNGVDEHRLRAIGYADTHPLASNGSAEGRAANRRVELIMRITPQRADGDGDDEENAAPTADAKPQVPANPETPTAPPQQSAAAPAPAPSSAGTPGNQGARRIDN